MGGVGSRNPSPVADGNKDAQSRMGGVGSRNPSPVADGNKDAQSSMGGGAKADQEGSTRDAEECLQGGSRGREEDASFGSELKGILTEMDDDLQRIVDKLSAPDAQRRLTPDAHQGRSKRRRLLPQIQLKNELLSDDNSSGQDQGTSEQQNSDNSCGAEDCLMEQEGDDGCSDLSDAAEEAGKGPLCHGHRHASVPYVKCSLPHCGKTFCAACAWNRNGEDAVASAATGCWVCPCCRDSNGSQGCGAGCSGCCICSRCRKRQGLPPTGLLYSTATASGFSNVHDYLVHNNTGEDAATIQARKQRHWWGRGIVSAQGVRKRAPAGSPKRLLRTRRSRQQCKKHMVGAPSKDGAGGASRADNGSGGNDQQAWVCCELCSKWRCTSPEFATQMADSDAQFRCCMLEGATCGDRCDWEWEEEQFQLLQAAGAEQAALQHQCEAPQTLQAVKLPGSVQEQQPHLLADLKAQELELLQKRRELEQQLQQQQQQQQQ
uniref:Zinc-finger domain-containing protein n=1 Tax=Dunaliella tertiolecta TaxID=3047 RepID=A0A7S3QWA9_DUNTE